MFEFSFPRTELVRRLQARVTHLENYNLVLVALPLAIAHREAPRLAAELNAHYVDFDRALLERLIKDGWDSHVEMERAGFLKRGRMLAQELLGNLARENLRRERPLVIGNSNLAVRYELDLVGILLPLTTQGVCILCAPGRVRDGQLYLHGTFPQAGRGIVLAWELAPETRS